MSRSNNPNQSNTPVLIDMQRYSVSITKWNQNEESKSIKYSWKEPSNPWTDPALISDWLDSLLEQEQIKDCEIAISLPRSLIGLHVLELPKVDDERLADLVGLHLEQSYHDKAHAITYDLAKLTHDNRNRELVLLGTLSTSLLSSIHAVCNKRALTLIRVGCMDFVAPEFPASSYDANAAIRSLVTIHGDHVCVSVVQGPHILQSQSVPMDDSEPNAKMLLGRLRLLEAALPEEIQKLPRLDGICLIDSDASIALSSQFAKQLGMRTITADLKKNFTRSIDSAVTKSIDFVNYWTPKRDRLAWKKIAVPAAILTSMAAVFFGIQQIRLTRLNQELTSLQNELNSTEQKIADLAEYKEKWNQIQSWKSTKLSWGQELVQIAKQSARFENTYLHRIQFESPDSEQTPSIRLEGRSKTVGDAISWNRFETESESRYSLVPQTIETSVSDPKFPIQFRTEATLPQSEDEVHTP